MNQEPNIPGSQRIDRKRGFAATLKRAQWVLLVLSCGCAVTPPASRKPAEPTRGFFEKMMDEVTERECNVGRFICPYGLGPAGEPCDCTDPSGVVLNGRTVK